MTNSVAILHNIRSVHNVGAMFRTADAAGISKIFLTGYTPTPLDRFGRARKDFAKVALGAEVTISWEFSKTPEEVIKKLKDDGFTVIAIEQSAKAKDYKTLKFPKKVAFVVGNEVDGLTADILKLADIVAEIPMQGKKESLNVSTAFGIAVFRILNI